MIQILQRGQLHCFLAEASEVVIIVDILGITKIWSWKCTAVQHIDELKKDRNTQVA